jgi:hypothetical protein
LFIFAVPNSSPDPGQVELNEINIKLGLTDPFNLQTSVESRYPPAGWRSGTAAPAIPNSKDRGKKQRKTPPATAGGVKIFALRASSY